MLQTVYDEYLVVVNDAQISFENLKLDVQTCKLFFSQHIQLEEHLCSIEEYLGQLIGEYEIERKTFQGDPPSKALASLSRLDDFLGPTERSN